MNKLQAGFVFLVTGPLAVYMTATFIRDLQAMLQAPKGRRIEAYYTSTKGYNPFTGKPGRHL